MITKKELLRKIDEAMRGEEAVVPLYLKNYSAALSWVGLGEKNRDRVASTFKDLGEQSEQHKRILNDVRNRIMEETRDVF